MITYPSKGLLATVIEYTPDDFSLADDSLFVVPLCHESDVETNEDDDDTWPDQVSPSPFPTMRKEGEAPSPASTRDLRSAELATHKATRRELHQQSTQATSLGKQRQEQPQHLQTSDVPAHKRQAHGGAAMPQEARARNEMAAESQLTTRTATSGSRDVGSRGTAQRPAPTHFQPQSNTKARECYGFDDAGGRYNYSQPKSFMLKGRAERSLVINTNDGCVNLDDHEYTESTCDGEIVLYSEKKFGGGSLTLSFTTEELQSSTRKRNGDSNVNDGKQTRFLTWDLKQQLCQCQSTLEIYGAKNYQGTKCRIAASSARNGLNLNSKCDNIFKSYKIVGSMFCCRWKVCTGYKNNMGNCAWLDGSGDNNVQGGYKFKVSSVYLYDTTSASNLNLNRWEDQVRSISIPAGCGVHLSKVNSPFGTGTTYYTGNEGLDQNFGRAVEYISIFQSELTWKQKPYLSMSAVPFSCRIVFYKGEDCSGSSHARYHDSDTSMNSYKPSSMQLLANDRSFIEMGKICRMALPLWIPVPISPSISLSIMIGFDDVLMTTPCKFELEVGFWMFLPTGNPLTDVFAVGLSGSVRVSLYRDYSGVYEVGGCIKSFIGFGLHELAKRLPSWLKNMLWIQVYMSEICIGAVRVRIHGERTWGGYLFIRRWPWSQIVGIYVFVGLYYFPEKLAEPGQVKHVHSGWEAGVGQKLWLVLGSIQLWQLKFGPTWQHIRW